MENKNGNISETRKDRGNVSMNDLTNALSNNNIPTPTASPSPRLGFATPTQNCDRKSREKEYTQIKIFMLGRHIEVF